MNELPLVLHAAPEAPRETGPVAVLRDWYEQQGHDDMLAAPSADLYLDPRSRMAPPGLRALVFEQLLSLYDPEALAKRLHERYPRATVRRLTAPDIARGLEAHREGLRLAEQWGLALYHVETEGLDGGRGKQDMVRLCGLAGLSVRRCELSGPRKSDTRIRLTGTGLRPDPMPEGWEWSGHKRWIRRLHGRPERAGEGT